MPFNPDEYLASKIPTEEVKPEKAFDPKSYLTQKQTAQKKMPLQMIEEAHPEISTKQRMVVKNFAQSPEAGAAYLNKEGFETELRDGDIYVRRPGEKSFKALDPKGLDVGDIGDIAYDIPAGIATGAATALGGVGGAMFGGGVGALPGAAAAGGLSSSGLEALRQYVGSQYGIPQEVSGRDVAISGWLGAASPLLLGTGAPGFLLAKAGVKEATQRGLISRGAKAAFPAIARGTSGIPTKAVETYINRTPEVDALIAQGPDAATNVAEETSKQIKDQFFTKKKEVGEALSKTISGSDNTIVTSEIFLPLEKRIQQLSQSERSLTPAGQAEIEAIRSQIDSLKEGLPDQISPQTAWELQDKLKDMSDFRNIKGTFQARFGSNASGAEKTLANAAADSVNVVNRELEKVAGTAGKKSEYKALSDLQKKLNKYFSTPEATERTLLQLDKPSKGAMRQTVDNLESFTGPTGVREKADLLEAYSYFQQPELLPISSGGTTSTSRSLGLSSAFEALGALGGEKGRAAGRAFGSIAGGPASVKGTIKAAKAGHKALGPIPARMSPWLNMKTREDMNK